MPAAADGQPGCVQRDVSTACGGGVDVEMVLVTVAVPLTVWVPEIVQLEGTNALVRVYAMGPPLAGVVLAAAFDAEAVLVVLLDTGCVPMQIRKNEAQVTD